MRPSLLRVTRASITYLKRFTGAAMSRVTRQQRTTIGRRPSLEWLESRQLLSLAAVVVAGGSPPISGSTANTVATSFMTPADVPVTSPAEAVSTTDPANGDSLIQSPGTLTITFNSLDPLFSLQYVFQAGDIQLEQMNPDGSTTDVLDESSYQNVSYPSYNQITIPLSNTLTQGQYSIVLVGNSGTSDFLSNYAFDQSGSLWDPSVDQTLATFNVLPPPVAASLSTATPIGSIGPQTQSITGSLDLTSLENVNIYEITLAPGHFWRLGVQLQALQIGSSLQGALSLFDSSGNVLATCNSGTGGLITVDPYLFSGLKPGIYYVGVSGAGNLAGKPGGYDPTGSGTFGTSVIQQAGGSYTLDLFADAADTPTEVLVHQLQWGDPLGTSPTGLTLDFSGSVDINSLNTAMTIPSAFEVVDQAGHAWPLSPTTYYAPNGQLSLVFDEPLPPGHYSLLNSSSDGLKDLAGWAPVCAGLPSGTLASWTVPPRASVTVPGYLGTVWPSQQGGAADSELILPGQFVTSQVYIPIHGFYSLNTVSPQGMLAVEQAGPSGLVLVDSGSPGASQRIKLDLSPGVYLFSFRNLAPQPALVTWQIVPSWIDHENLTDNGVGQSGALGLRLITPITAAPLTISQPGTTPEPNVPATPSGSITAMGVAPGLVGLITLNTDVTPIPASLFLSSSSGLLAAPSAGVAGIETVEAAVAGGWSFVAGGTLDVRPGVADRWYGTSENGNSAQRGENAPTSDEAVASLHRPAAQLDPTESSTADALALSKSDRIVELAAQLGRWFGLGTGEENPGMGMAPTALDLLARDGTEPGQDSGRELSGTSMERMVEADLGMPVGLVFVAAAAYRLRQFTGRWWRDTRGRRRVSGKLGVGQPVDNNHAYRGRHVGAGRVRVSRGF